MEIADGVKPATQKLSSQPRGVAALPDMSVVAIACHKSVIVYEFQTLKHMLNVSYEGTCVDVHPTNKKIAVGGQVITLTLFLVRFYRDSLRFLPCWNSGKRKSSIKYIKLDEYGRFEKIVKILRSDLLTR